MALLEGTKVRKYLETEEVQCRDESIGSAQWAGREEWGGRLQG